MSFCNEADVVNEIFSLYENPGKEEYPGKPVSHLEHMSQAARLAIMEGFDDEVVLACFFHDIGNICVARNQENSMGGHGIHFHEKIGADFLRGKGFPERIAQLVELHVQAKRYLLYKYPEYAEQLSDAGKATLEFQGGVMSQEEANEFERNPLFMVSILMRKWDEMSNEVNIPVIDLSILKQVMIDVLIKRNKTAFIQSQEFFNSI